MHLGLTQAGQITEITTSEKGESNITIVNSNGTKTSQSVPAGLSLIVKQGDIVKADQPLNIDPNVVVLVKKNQKLFYKILLRIVGYLAFCFCVLLTQILLVLKKKQFEKVQAAELNF
jgi:apocytochrome f